MNNGAIWLVLGAMGGYFFAKKYEVKVSEKPSDTETPAK